MTTLKVETYSSEIIFDGSSLIGSVSGRSPSLGSSIDNEDITSLGKNNSSSVSLGGIVFFIGLLLLRRSIFFVLS